MESKHRIPLWLKLVYTAFMAVLVPVYWTVYGPTNFLYFCDIALFLTLVAIWKEHRLLTSIGAAGIVFPQLLWCVDYLTGFFGYFPLGFTQYMFEHETPFEWFADGLSLFHGWLPFLLLFMVARLGYDRRAFVWWWAIAWVAMVIAYFWLPAVKDLADPNLPYNVNYVYGIDEPQEWISAEAWFALMLVVMPLVFSLPAHLVMNKIWGDRDREPLPAEA